MTSTSLKLFGQFEVGAKGGLNISEIKTTDIPYSLPLETNSILGFHIGLFTQLDFTDKFHLNSDILFTTRGYKLEDFNTTISYLEIPILLSYSIIEKLEIELGPDMGLKLSEKSDISGLSYESLDFGVATGLRYNLIDKIFLTGRYYHGLTSIETLAASSAPSGPPFDESKSFYRVIQFSIGYKIK